MVTIEFNVDENNLITKKTFGILKKADLSLYRFKFNFAKRSLINIPKVCYLRSLTHESYEPVKDGYVNIPTEFNGASKISICLYLRFSDGDRKTNAVVVDIEQ